MKPKQTTGTNNSAAVTIDTALPQVSVPVELSLDRALESKVVVEEKNGQRREPPLCAIRK